MSVKKAIQFLDILLSVPHAVPFVDFPSSEWGDSDSFRRFYKNINNSWRECRGHNLFEVVGEVTRGERGEDRRLFKLVDPDILAARNMGQPVMPVFLEFFPSLKGTVFEEQLETVFRDRYRGGTDRFRANLRKKFYYFGRGKLDYSSKSDVLRNLYDALLREKIVRVERKRTQSGERVEEELKPLTLVLFNSALYLLAIKSVDESDKVLKFKLDHIETAQCLEKHPFPYPDDYAPETIFQDSFGFMQGDSPIEVLLEVKDGWALEYLKGRTWTSTDEFTQENGHTYFRFITSDLREVVKFVIGLEDQVRVVSPDELRDEILASVSRIASVYSKDLT